MREGRNLTSEAVQAISRLADRDEIARHLAKLLASRYSLSFCGYSVWDWERKLFVEHVGIPADAEPVHLRIEDLDEFGFGQAVKADRVRLVHDIEEEGLCEGEWEALRRFGTRSYITLPYHIRRRVAGAFGVASSIPDHFDDQDIRRLAPVVQVLGLKLAELGSRAPRNLGPRTSVLPSRVLVVGRDPTLNRRIARMLPQEIHVEFFAGKVDSTSVERSRPSITIWCCKRLDQPESERIERALRRRPRRSIVICSEANPRAVSLLMERAKPHGLVTVESDDLGPDDLGTRLERWCLGDSVRPNWEALGLRRERSDPGLERVLRVLEREPFRNWRVADLAREAAMSQETLNRTIQTARGSSAKPFLMDLRFELIQRFRQSGELSGAQVYELFGFSSAEKMREWCRIYRRKRKTLSMANKNVPLLAIENVPPFGSWGVRS